MKFKIIIFTLLIALPVGAQKYKYGGVEKADLQKEKSIIDPEAVAEILYEKANIKLEYDDFENQLKMIKEIEGRIKIYNKDQVSDEFLNVKVPIYSSGGSSREKISGFTGTTYNMEDGKIEKTKVRNADIFSDKRNKYWTTEKFAFPNVKDGSVLEYKYTISSPFIQNLGRWFFQYDIPVVYSEYTVSKPEYMILSPDIRGEISGRKSTNQYPAMGRSYNNDIIEHVYENVRPLKEEPYVLNPNNLRSSIRYEIMQFSYPGVLTQNFSTSWEQIGRDLMNDSKFGGELSGNRFLDETVQSLTAGENDPMDKMQAIFDYVKMNYSWNNFRSIKTENGLRSTFKDKIGNVADINLLLVSMLQKAGINAAPVVLSTVENLMLNYSFPSVSGLDFVIASAEVGGQLFLMDATEKHSDINMLPLRDLNHRGFRIEPGKVIEVPLMNTSVSLNKVTVNVSLSEDGEISGGFTETKSQYLAMTDNMRMADNPKNFENRYLSDYNFDIDDFRIDKNEDKGMVRYMFKFEDVKMGQKAGDKIIINPTLFTQTTRNPFVQSSRNYPLEFGSAVVASTVIKIQIPEGYKVESLPETRQYVLENNAAGYAYKVESNDTHITLVSSQEVASSVLPQGYYGPMKDLQSKIIETEGQQVVLVKQ